MLVYATTINRIEPIIRVLDEQIFAETIRHHRLKEYAQNRRSKNKDFPASIAVNLQRQKWTILI
jgi:hypothetical protein